jgi:ribonuclease HII
MKVFKVGVDEVGRGPVAGPIIFCFFISFERLSVFDFFEDGVLRDSKKCSEKIRQKVFSKILMYQKQKKVDYLLLSRDASFIDTYGMRAATISIFEEALILFRKKKLEVSFDNFLLDGALPSCYGNVFIKGDEKFLEISLASITAKVSRDLYMKEQAAFFPLYGWEKNSGYATKGHREAIVKYGITELHRKTFLQKILV